MKETFLPRRDFIKGLGLIVAGVSQFGFSSFSEADSADYVTFDFHTHPGLFFTKGTEVYKGDAFLNKTLADIKSGHLTGGFFSLVADAKVIQIGPTGVKPYRSYEPKEAWQEYLRQIKILKDIIAGGDLSLATKGSDLIKAHKNKKCAAYISVEGGDFLEGDAGRLEEMYKDGVRSIQLVHYHPNELGDLQTEVPTHKGLSAAGKEVVRKMNQLKMIIDVAHATEETTKAVASLTDSPIILSHTMLSMGNDRPLARRTISVDHAKAIAQTGGVIGAWPSGFNTSFEEFIDNTLRLVDAAGIDHVGLGTDMDGNFKPVFSSYTQLPQWIDALKGKGLKDEEVRKIVGGNAQRVLNGL